MDSPVSGAKSAFDHRGVLIVAAAAFACALTGAWMRPVWHDELYTLYLSRMPMTELISALVVDSGPPLHYLLCHVLFVLVGWQEGSALGTLVVRLPSVLAFALLPWVVGRARAVTNRTSPWGPLLVVAWLPLLYFGTEARTYALLALVNALVWIRGPAWIERGGRRIVLFALTAACLPLLHYAGVASFVALPALAFFIKHEHRRRLAFAITGAALPTLAWFPMMAGAPRASMAWVATGAGPGRPGLATAEVLAPAGPFPALYEVSATALPPWMSVSILFLLIAGALIGGGVLWKNRPEKNLELQSAARLCIGLLPAAGLGLAALAGLPLYFAGRTESMVWPLAAALFAILISGLPPAARRTVAGAYVVVGAMTVAMWIADLPSQPPAPGIGVGRALASRIAAGDRVLVAGLWQLEVQHGIVEGSFAEPVAPITVETVPRSQAKHPGWLDRDAVLSPLLAAEAREMEERARLEGSRIWVVWSPALPLERNFFPAFAGWRRDRIAGSPIIAVDLLTLLPVEAPFGPSG
jgi:hypothetical protein